MAAMGVRRAFSVQMKIKTNLGKKKKNKIPTPELYLSLANKQPVPSPESAAIGQKSDTNYI